MKIIQTHYIIVEGEKQAWIDIIKKSVFNQYIVVLIKKLYRSKYVF